MPNEHGEKLCSLNLERIAFYIGSGIKLSEDVSTLLGECALHLILMQVIFITYLKKKTGLSIKFFKYLTGLAGFLPQSPHAYKMAWRNREEILYQEEQAVLKPKTE